VKELTSFNFYDILETKVDMVVKELLGTARAIPGDKHQIRKRSRKLLWRLNGTKHPNSVYLIKGKLYCTLSE
jgi:hypothetical protein